MKSMKHTIGALHKAEKATAAGATSAGKGRKKSGGRKKIKWRPGAHYYGAEAGTGKQVKKMIPRPS